MRNKFLNRKTIIFGTAITVVVLSAGSYIFVQYQKQQNQVIQESKVDVLSVQEVVDRSKKRSVILSGEVVANNGSKVKIDPSKGEVKEVFVKNGDTVTAGQPLFSYATAQELAAQSAQYDAQSKANAITAAQNSAALKWDSYHRKVAHLNQQKEKYNSSQDDSLLEQIKSGEDEVNQALIDARSAENDVKNAQIEAEKAQVTAQTETERMKYDVVKADTDGVITSMNADLPNQSKAKKEEETFLEIMDRSKTFVKGNISEFDREKLEVGQKVEIVDRKDPKKKWNGTVTQVGTLTADASSNNAGNDNKQQENPNQAKYPYKVELEQAGQMPLIGAHTYVNVIENAPEAGKIVVNKSYIFEKDGKTYVWKVVNKKIQQQEVKVQKISDQLVEITEGVSLEDQISSPKEDMKDGMEVGQRVNP